MHRNLRSLLDTLRREDEIVVIDAAVDAYLEIAEIHRRVIEPGGKALLFTNVKNSKFPLVTNLFGTCRRIDLAFGKRPEEVIRRAVQAVEVLMPPSISKLWQFRDLASTALKVGTRKVRRAPVREMSQSPPRLSELPLLQLWPRDGGHFITLPLVYTESPTTGKPNLGMYRAQRFSDSETGVHWQIGKGGGFHYHEAETLGQSLPVTIFLGGPPALIVSAIAPLPEGVPEILLASLLAGEKLEVVKNAIGGHHRLIAEAEFAICGSAAPDRRRPEGPFGDHYGYYSLEHDYPVFEAAKVFHRRDAIFPATVVGQPRQEDYFIGDYLQELLSPLFPLVMPAVRDLWSYGETGFHSLAAAVVRERYAREALSAGFRILGEGQLALTKFLLLTDTPQNLKDFKSLFEHILARVNWQTDFFIFARTAFDTLDYTSGTINHGSKAILMGLGEARRDLTSSFTGQLPTELKRIEVFCSGCLAVEPAEGADSNLAESLAANPAFQDWQVIVILDDAGLAQSTEKFLWATWTRFDPASHIAAFEQQIERGHISYSPPIVIDARMKTGYPNVVEPDPKTVNLVDERWSEYFSSGDPF